MFVKSQYNIQDATTNEEVYNVTDITSECDKNLRADSSTRCNKDEPDDGWLRMSRHHDHSNYQVQVARCTSTSPEKNDIKFKAL